MANDTDVFSLNPALGGYDECLEFLNGAAETPEKWDRDRRVKVAHDARYIEAVGKYVTPASTTWEDYSSAVRTAGMAFDPEHYLFDKAVGLSSRNRAVYDPAAFYYSEYEPLRHNLAVMRNFVLNHLHDDAEVRDQQKLSTPVQIAHEIGDMLRRGNSFFLASPFAPRIRPKDANIDYVGAVTIYQQLLRVQNRHPLLNFLLRITGRQYTRQHWGLPPLEQTPFGVANKFAPVSVEGIASGEAAAPPHHTALRHAQEDALAVGAADVILTSGEARFNSIDSLSQTVKIEAIEIAREILKKLKIQFQDTPFLAVLNYNSDHFQRNMTDMKTVIAVYLDHLQRGLALDPSLKNDRMVLRADEVIGFIGAQIKLRALDRAEMLGNTEYAATLRSELERLPARWLNPNSFTSNDVFAALEQAIEMVAVTLQQIQKENMGQNQRELMMQASLLSPEEQHRRMQSLSFDDAFQRLAAERQAAFIAQLGGQPAHPPRQGGVLQDATHAAGRKQGKSELSAPPTVGFDTLLASAGANIQQIQSSINTPTSGNFNPAAPGTIQQTIQQTIAHHGKTGSTSATAGAKSTQPGQRGQQRRAEEKQSAAPRKQNRSPPQETPPPENKKPEEIPPIPPAGSRRDRPPTGRG